MADTVTHIHRCPYCLEPHPCDDPLCEEAINTPCADCLQIYEQGETQG